MNQDLPSTSERHRTSSTTSPTAAEFRGSGRRTTAGAVGSALAAVVPVAAVLAPTVLLVVAAVALTGGAVVGATDVGRDASRTESEGESGSDAH